MKFRLQSGMLEAPPEGQQDSDAAIERPALLVYTGKFDSMDGPVEITDDHVRRLIENHNSLLSRAKRLATGEIPAKYCPPIQLDHSPSATMTVGRLVGDLRPGVYLDEETGESRNAIYGTVRFLGKENVEKVKDGRWTHLSIGADLDEAKLSELTVTPFPAAANASLLGGERLASDEVSVPLYKFKNPEPGEQSLRFIMVEDNGDRGMFREVTKFRDWTISPLFLYKTADMVKSGTFKVNKNELSNGGRMYAKLKKFLTKFMRMSEADADKKLAGMEDKEKEQLSAEAEKAEKMKKHLMEKEKLSEEQADEKLSKMTDDEKVACSKEVEEHEKLAAEEVAKKAQASAGSAGPAKMSLDPEKLAQVKRLSAGMVASGAAARLAEKEMTLGVRLSKLRASAKITPAEAKKIDLAHLSKENDATIEAVFKSYENREPVIHTGVYGTMKATNLSEVASKNEKARLEAETRANMSLLKKKKNKGSKLAGEGHQEPDGDEETVQAAAPQEEQVEQMGHHLKHLHGLLEQGKVAEAMSHLKAMMTGGAPQEQPVPAHVEKQMSALATSLAEMQNQFIEYQKLVGPVLGIDQ